MEVSLKEISKIVTGNTPSKKNKNYWNSEDICFIKPDVIGSGIDSITTSNEYISNFARPKARIVDRNTILITCIGNIGRIGIVSDKKVAFNQQINAIIPNYKINIRYLAYVLLFSQPRLNALANSAVVPIVNKTQLGNFKIKINPNVESQGKIVSILDKIAKIIKNQTKEIKRLDELIKARFVEMFGDPVINSKNLELSTLANLGMLGRGRSKHRPRNDPKLLGGKYPLIQTGEISQSGLYIRNFSNTYSELGLKQSKLWPKDTLCITIAANIASTSILTFNACFPDSVVGFISNEDKVKPVFLHYWFSFFQNIIESQATQVAQKNINLKVLSNLSVIHPPLSLQNEFADFVRQVDKSKVAVQKSLDETQKLFNSLMQKYFG